MFYMAQAASTEIQTGSYPTNYATKTMEPSPVMQVPENLIPNPQDFVQAESGFSAQPQACSNGPMPSADVPSPQPFSTPFEGQPSTSKHAKSTFVKGRTS